MVEKTVASVGVAVVILLSNGCQATAQQRTGVAASSASSDVAREKLASEKLASEKLASGELAREPRATVAASPSPDDRAARPARPAGQDAAVRLTAGPWSASPSLIDLPPGHDVREFLGGNHRRVLLDFHADWCGPCKQQGRILDEVEPVADSADALMIKINVEQHPELAQQLSVRSVPTLVLLGDGRVLAKRTGLMDAGELAAWLR